MWLRLTLPHFTSWHAQVPAPVCQVWYFCWFESFRWRSGGIRRFKSKGGETACYKQQLWPQSLMETELDPVVHKIAPLPILDLRISIGLTDPMRVRFRQVWVQFEYNQHYLHTYSCRNFKSYTFVRIHIPVPEPQRNETDLKRLGYIALLSYFPFWGPFTSFSCLTSTSPESPLIITQRHRTLRPYALT